MLDRTKLTELLTLFAKEMKNLFGEKLVEVILFGSYSNDKQDEDSDIDLMVLLDLSEESTNQYTHSVAEIASELCLEFNVLLSPILQSKEQFDKYKDILPFFKNVEMGVKIVA